MRGSLSARVDRLEQRLAESEALLRAMLECWGDECSPIFNVDMVLSRARAHLRRGEDQCFQCGHRREEHLGGAGRCGVDGCWCSELIAATVH